MKKKHSKKPIKLAKKSRRPRKAAPTTAPGHFSDAEVKTLAGYFTDIAFTKGAEFGRQQAEHAAPTGEPMIILDTVRGAAAIVRSEILAIGAVFEKPGVPVNQRILYLRGSHELYVLDSRENITKILGAPFAEEFNNTPLHPKVKNLNPDLFLPKRGRRPFMKADPKAAAGKGAPTLKQQLNESAKATTPAPAPAVTE